MQSAKIVVPIRYSAWLAGDLGSQITQMLAHGLAHMEDLRITRLPRAILVEAAEEPGPLLEATWRAVEELEQGVGKAYPVFHHEMGPVWTGTLQAVFAAPQPAPEAHGLRSR